MHFVNTWSLCFCATRPTLRTRGKPLLAERQSVSCSLQLHVHPRQGAPLIHKLHCQGGGVRGAIRQLELGPQRPSTWGWAKTNTVTNGSSGSITQDPQTVKDSLPSFSDFSEISLSFHRHLFCSAFLKKRGIIHRYNCSCSTLNATAELPGIKAHHRELGRDCMLVTPPSTATKIWTLVSGPGQAMESGL